MSQRTVESPAAAFLDMFFKEQLFWPVGALTGVRFAVDRKIVYYGEIAAIGVHAVIVGCGLTVISLYVTYRLWIRPLPRGTIRCRPKALKATAIMSLAVASPIWGKFVAADGVGQAFILLFSVGILLRSGFVFHQSTADLREDRPTGVERSEWNSP